MKHQRNQIIQIGQELFRENGYEATGVAEIIKVCGISKGSFYNYFSTKENFALECLTTYSLQVQKLMNTYLNFISISPTKRLERYFQQLIKINEKEGANKGCLLMNIMVELSGKHSLFQQKTAEEFEQWIVLLIPTIEEAQLNKELTKRYTAKQIAHYLYAHIFGNFVYMKTLRNTTLMERELRMVFQLLKIN